MHQIDGEILFCWHGVEGSYFNFQFIAISVPNRQNVIPGPSRPNNATPRTNSHSSLVGVTRDGLSGAISCSEAAFDFHLQAAHLSLSIVGYLQRPGAPSARESTESVAAADSTLSTINALHKRYFYEMDAGHGRYGCRLDIRQAGNMLGSHFACTESVSSVSASSSTRLRAPKLISFCDLGDDVFGRIRQAIYSRDSRINHSML